MSSPPPPPAVTRYDQIARYLLRHAGGRLFAWLLGTAAPRFVQWLPTQLTLPNTPERLCDLIAELADDARGGVPVAALVEVQTQPDPVMAGRLMMAGGLLWLTAKPAALPGDRYDLLAVVVNLTGRGDAARAFRIGPAEWAVRPVERNLSALDAAAVLDDIAAGTAPEEVLAFVPLMHGGGDDDIIERWRRVVAADPDPRRRADFALAVMFAQKTTHLSKWRTAVEEVITEESSVFVELFERWKAKQLELGRAEGIAEGVAQGKAEGVAQGKAEGKVQGRADVLLRTLGKRFGPVPPDVAAAVRACADVTALDAWIDHALDATSLEQFRKSAGV
jgi:hypothetical protein